MPKLRSVYAGGYSDEKKRRLQNYKLPPKINCIVCRKTKGLNFFSTIQQNELQKGMATGQVMDAALEAWVTCVACSPKQVTELECCICEEVKGLDGFAKAQRRLGENARCMTCVASLNGEAPVEGKYAQHLINLLEDDGDDDDSSQYSTSNAHESSTFGDSVSSAGVHVSSGSTYNLEDDDFSSLNLSSNNLKSEPSAGQEATKASAATKRLRVPANRAGKWQDFAKENDARHVESTNRAQFTAFDPEGKAHQMARPASTVDSDDSSNDTIPDPREQARIDKEQRDARSKFAKIPGGRAVPTFVPSYVGGKTVPDHKHGYDDDADDDDDWGTI